MVEIKERRTSKRFKVNEGTFAFFGSTPCRILDISETGMAVNHVMLNNKTLSTVFFDLFSAEKEEYLSQIPGELVNEVALFPMPLFSVLPTKRLCIKFDELTSAQREKIRLFIDSNAVGEA